MKLRQLMNPSLYLKLKNFQWHGKIYENRQLLKSNTKYKNIHKGERCFIIANGPSINNLDFSLLRNEVTFTVNQMSRNAEFEKLNANYHMWSDRIFFEIEDGNEEDMEMLRVIKAVSEKAPNVEVFYELTAKEMIDKYHLDQKQKLAYFYIVNGLNADVMEKRLMDFSEPLPNYPTVIDYAICLAVYMGFKEIYLLGCDCTGFINIAQNKMKGAKNSLYAFEMTQNGAKRMERYSEQRSIKSELSSYVALFEQYEKLEQYCERNGAKLYNATDGGLLECLSRVNLVDVLTRKSKSI